MIDWEKDFGLSFYCPVYKRMHDSTRFESLGGFPHASCSLFKSVMNDLLCKNVGDSCADKQDCRTD